ncbi:MAG TPA: hypothetical protein VGF34_00365 [Stellaceae bacterium]|jgi:hypothetical protein
MRSLLVPASLAALVAACTPYIPVKDSFGTSALRPAGSIPPEFAAFNNYDPRVNALLADQLCATPDTLLVTQAAPAAPGEVVGATERCQDYTTGLPEVAPPSAAWPP